MTNGIRRVDPTDSAPPASAAGARSLIIHPFLQKLSSQRSPENRLEEAVSLCAALDLQIKGAMIIPLAKLRPATYLGRGKIEELEHFIADHEVELVVADCQLSPIQQRNLERDLKAKVIDRTGLILEIFGERAETREGTLQVELAHLMYQKSRLVRSWTHLERQRGGFGFLGGPGESQIESDRRQINERISKIRKQLESVVRTRELHRESRRKVPFPIIALVGYTNAGKSTLFNALTQAKVVAKDMLFATLDPTMRNLELPNGQKSILSDTVGFISDLPTHLVAAFRATLEEVLEADIILHVRDISHPDTEAQRTDVLDILKSLGIEEGGERIIVEIWNKADLLDEENRLMYENLAENRDDAVLFSALEGTGCPALLDNIAGVLSARKKCLTFRFEPQQGREISWLYQNGEVVERTDSESETLIRVRLDSRGLGQVEKRGYHLVQE